METNQTPTTERVKTLADALAINGVSEEEFALSIANDTPDEVAYKQLKQITKALNPPGWVADFSNGDQYKYSVYAYNYQSGFGFSYSFTYCWLTVTFVGARLLFASRDLARYAGEQFRDIYNQYFA